MIKPEVRSIQILPFGIAKINMETEKDPPDTLKKAIYKDNSKGKRSSVRADINARKKERWSDGVEG